MASESRKADAPTKSAPTQRAHRGPVGGSAGSLYVRNAWYVASWKEDLGPEAPVAVTILGERIVLWRSAGRVMAFEDRCIHRLAPLSRGRCEGANLRCMYHGLLFNTEGQVVEIPGQPNVPPDARVRSFPVFQQASWIWVWMGDPALADEALIPPAIALDDPDWMMGRGQIDYEAEARLINDNLLDFSHFAFVHEQSLKTNRSHAEHVPNVSPMPRGVRFQSWREPDGAAAEHWNEHTYIIPGILFSQSATFPAGTGAACDRGFPDLALATHIQVACQAVTPTGERTARYFFSFGVHRRFGDEAWLAKMMATLDQAYAEDKAMIEAQQKIIDATPVPRIMPTAHDRGVIMFNQQVAALVREERSTLGF